jgi:hypothetical protein
MFPSNPALGVLNSVTAGASWRRTFQSLNTEMVSASGEIPRCIGMD